MATRSAYIAGVNAAIYTNIYKFIKGNTVRDKLNLLATSAVFFEDGDTPGGFLKIDSVTGAVDVSFIKSASPTGLFLKDDGTWDAAGAFYTAGSGLQLIGQQFSFASNNISQFTNNSGYITSSALTPYVPFSGAGSLLDFNTQRVLAGSANIGNKTQTSQRALRIGQGTAFIDIGSNALASSLACIYMNKGTPSPTNYTLAVTATGDITELVSAGDLQLTAITGFILNINSSSLVEATSTVFKINGKLKQVDGAQANGYVLTSDANGLATWAAPAGGSAALTQYYVGVGDSGGNLSGSSNLTFNGMLNITQNSGVTHIGNWAGISGASAIFFKTPNMVGDDFALAGIGDDVYINAYGTLSIQHRNDNYMLFHAGGYIQVERPTIHEISNSSTISIGTNAVAADAWLEIGPAAGSLDQMRFVGTLGDMIVNINGDATFTNTLTTSKFIFSNGVTDHSMTYNSDGLCVRVGNTDLSTMYFRSWTALTNYPALYMGVAPAGANYSMIGTGTNTIINTPENFGCIKFWHADGNDSAAFYISKSNFANKVLFGDVPSSFVLNGTPTATVHIKPPAGNGYAPLRIEDSVTTPSTINDNDIWIEGTDIKVRLSGVTYTLVKV